MPVPPQTQLGFDVPAQWAAQSQQASRTDSMATGQGWVSDFDDSRLPSLVTEALAHNYDLKQAAARMAASRAQVTIVGADRLPQLAASGEAARAKTIAQQTRNTYSLTLDLSWELDMWGRLRNQQQAALADFQASEANLRAAQLSIAAQIAQAWFNVIASELQWRLAEQTADSFAHRATFIRQRYHRGIADALDLRLIQADAMAAKAQTEQQLRLHQEAVRGLEILLGRYPRDALRAAATLPQVKKTVPAGLPSELLLRRPDLIAAEQEVVAALLRHKVAVKTLLPSINLTGKAGQSSRELRDLLDPTTRIWHLIGSLTQPLFQGWRLRAGVEQAKAVITETLANYQQTALIAFAEVENALAAETLIVAEEQALAQATTAFLAAEALAWDNYRRGLVDIITVLDTQNLAFSAQRSLIALRNSRLQSRVSLYLALGGDFADEALVVSDTEYSTKNNETVL